MARGLLGRDHPLQMRHQRRQALREADCVLLAGVPCDFRLDYGKHVRRSATLIAANRSAREARMNRKPDVAAIGDAGALLVDLARDGAGDPARRADWVAQLRARDAARETEIETQAAERGEFVNPIALLRALDREAGDDAVFVADGGDFVATAAYVLRPRSPLSWLDPGAFGTLGVGAGFALGAALARPGSEVWIVFGDGACGWGLAEFDTFVRHGIPVIAVVGNDGGWTQIAREQVKMLGDDVATVLARTAYHEVAAGFGAAGPAAARRRRAARHAGARAGRWRAAARRCCSTCGWTRRRSARARSRCEQLGSVHRRDRSLIDDCCQAADHACMSNPRRMHIALQAPRAESASPATPASLCGT
jgi:thiamine pyrophosphate-dependent acetolactate synthase large subunit-like protein